MEKWNIISIPFLIVLFLLVACWRLGKEYDQAMFFAERDLLSAVYNRRAVDKLLPKLVARADRFQEKICVLLVDIDNFKKINDEYGHEKGDIVIRHVSDALQKITRKGDIVARWGGDEFLVISRNVDEVTVPSLLSRMESEIDYLSSLLGFRFSISIGVAFYPTDGSTMGHVVVKADRNMYEVKAGKKKSS